MARDELTKRSRQAGRTRELVASLATCLVRRVTAVDVKGRVVSTLYEDGSVWRMCCVDEARAEALATRLRKLFEEDLSAAPPGGRDLAGSSDSAAGGKEGSS
ncbi:MAG TPA: hypothetical protein VM492_13490 [Sumerlaeia bacterium]|nr:hypothetical protein [Sumerlaeia bacterium]